MLICAIRVKKMKQKLNLDTWNRKEHFLFFKQMQEPFFGVTITIDCTKAYTKSKELGISFYDIVNRYRIQHVSIPMIEKDGSIYSIEEIALASGFGSISTFKRAFKKITNMPPGIYMERNSEDE